MNRGFSLFELLIVMSIIGILAAIIFPTYNHHMAKVNCQRATIALLHLGNKIEQAYNLAGDYREYSLEPYLNAHMHQLPYRFSYHASKRHFTITATANKPQTLTKDCRRLQLTHGENSDLIP